MAVLCGDSAETDGQKLKKSAFYLHMSKKNCTFAVGKENERVKEMLRKLEVSVNKERKKRE